MHLLLVWVRSGPSPPEERATRGWGGGLPWRTRQCVQRSLVLDTTDGWGNTGVGPIGPAGLNSVQPGSLPPALRTVAWLSSGAMSTHTCAHGTCPGPNPIAGRMAPSPAAHTHPLVACDPRRSGPGEVCTAALLVCGDCPREWWGHSHVPPHEGAGGTPWAITVTLGAGEGKCEGSPKPSGLCPLRCEMPRMVLCWCAWHPRGNCCEVTC